MTDEWERNTIMVRAEAATMLNLFTTSIDWDAVEREAELDRTIGPRLGPDRFDLWEINRSARKAANLRRNLGNGRPVGPVRR